MEKPSRPFSMLNQISQSQRVFCTKDGGGDGGADLLYFSEESVGTLDLPLTQLSKGHFLKVNLKTGHNKYDV